MTNIAWRNLSRQRTRLFISVAGVAFSVFLILIIRGLYVGLIDQATTYVRHVEADLWVADASAPAELFQSQPLLPKARAGEVAALEGVAVITPVLGRLVTVTMDGEETEFFLLSVDTASGVGRPRDLERGSADLQPGEIVVDRVFARNNGIGIDDVVVVNGHELRVSGLAREGNAIVSQFAWTSYADAGAIFGGDERLNYLLIGVADGADVDAVAERIRALGGLRALSEDEFVDENIADLSESLLPLIWVLVVIGMVIGIAVIGLTIYTATLERRREYGMLKAVGFSNRRLFVIVGQQALIIGSLGFVAGVALTTVLAAVIEAVVPMFVTSIRPFDVVFAGVAVAVMSVLSSLIPARPVARLHPAEVFRV